MTTETEAADLQAEVQRLTNLLERNGARYCRCSRADRANGVAWSGCPHHGDGLQTRLRQALNVVAAVEPVTAEIEAETSEGKGRRHDFWQGRDYEDGYDAGLEKAAEILRAALESGS